MASDIVISPVGDIDGKLLRYMGREIQRVFDYPTRILSLMESVRFAYDAQRDQYLSTSILDRLQAAAPSGTVKVLGIVSVDLFIPILTHVYGEAQLGGIAAVVSTCRLEGDLPTIDTEAVFRARMIKEAIHELGHTFNLRHCPESTCIMHYCRNEQDVDRKSNELCRYCRTLTEDERRRIQDPVKISSNIQAPNPPGRDK